MDPLAVLAYGAEQALTLTGAGEEPSHRLWPYAALYLLQ